jgi:hypothetical protein
MFKEYLTEIANEQSESISFLLLNLLFVFYEFMTKALIEDLYQILRVL